MSSFKGEYAMTEAFKLGAIDGFEWAAERNASAAMRGGFTSAELRKASRDAADKVIGTTWNMVESLTPFGLQMIQTARSDYVLAFRQAAQGIV